MTTTEDQRDEIFYLEEELARARSRIKEFEKENIKNRKKIDKLILGSFLGPFFLTFFVYILFVFYKVVYFFRFLVNNLITTGIRIL